MITSLTDSNFEQVTRQPGIVIVDCWAAWCGTCRQFEKVYRRVAEKRSQHTFTELDTETQKNLRSALGISHIPSLLLYRDGILLFKEPGNFDEETLSGIIDQAEALDMEMVRAEMAKAGPDPEADENQREIEQ
jgi:thioredoxin 1